jgi:hypothetical protein
MKRAHSDRCSRVRTRREARPSLEGLEGRVMLSAANGGQWQNPGRITYSFAPDGTNVGGTPSNLFATLNKVAPTATWEAAIEQAMTLWSTYGHINVV